jgi:hypothetical protein
MARRKTVDNTEVKQSTPLFLTAGTAKTTTKMVSVRLNTSLLERFQAASKLASAKGFELSLTRVMHQAIELAIAEVENAVPPQQDLNL